MSTVVVYWSGTGNTEAMAEAVAAAAGVSATAVADISAADALNADTLLLGCPAMGDEALEEDEMEPFFTELEAGLSGKNVGLFGSYDWGDGDWMKTWEGRVTAAGGKLIKEGIIANLEPDDDAIAACKALGEAAAAL